MVNAHLCRPSLTSTLLVLFAACDTNALMPIAFLRRILVAIGARSYGIYLAHVPIYFAVREIFHRFEWQPSSTTPMVIASLALWAALLMIAVEVVYRYIETPLRQIGAKKAQIIPLQARHERFGTQSRLSIV